MAVVTIARRTIIEARKEEAADVRPAIQAILGKITTAIPLQLRRIMERLHHKVRPLVMVHPPPKQPRQDMALQPLQPPQPTTQHRPLMATEPLPLRATVLLITVMTCPLMAVKNNSRPAALSQVLLLLLNNPYYYHIQNTFTFFYLRSCTGGLYLRPPSIYYIILKAVSPASATGHSIPCLLRYSALIL